MGMVGRVEVSVDGAAVVVVTLGNTGHGIQVGSSDLINICSLVFIRAKCIDLRVRFPHQVPSFWQMTLTLNSHAQESLHE